ncbi:MAG: hypothetical protein U9R23_06395 [Candidatus Cloacimonadota bacterium]|nr:hypothetical protein [Candidatus Cloacimonadota bacterium]
MKKLLILFIGIFIFSTLFAWDDCPFGQKNCPYPGICGAYIDTDSNSICDRSQPAPENREKISKEISDSLTNKREVDIGILETEKELLVRKYHFIPISIVLIVLYLITFTLFKLKIFTRVTHLIIWNCILLISFMVSSLLGILLIIRVNFGLPISLPFNILFWHVESGIVMMVIGIFHLIYNRRFYKYIFMKK